MDSPSKSIPTAKSRSLFPNVLGKVIPLRLRRSNADVEQRESAITSLASASLRALAIAPGAVFLERSAPQASHGCPVSAPGTEPTIEAKKTLGSRALDYINVFGTALTPFVETIPVVGTPLKAAIGGLLGILTIVDVSAKRL